MENPEKGRESEESRAARLESSDEALDLEAGIQAFEDKWTADTPLGESLRRIRSEQDGAETRGKLAVLLALGGAMVTVYGVPEEMRQYMDSNAYDLADMQTQIFGPLGVAGGLSVAWHHFKESFDKREQLKSLLNL